ncbi:hypothetical protein M8C21_031418, partial [Ambrosia artemisiifolia]
MVKVSPGTKSGNKRSVKKVVKRTIVRKKGKSAGVETPPSVEGSSVVAGEEERLEEVKDVVCVKREEASPNDVKDVGVSDEGVKEDVKVEDGVEDVEDGVDVRQSSVEDVEDGLRNDSVDVKDVGKSVEDREPEVGEGENAETEKKDLGKEEVVDDEKNGTDDEEPFEIEELDTDVEKNEREIEESGTEVGKQEPDVEELAENKEITLDKDINVETEQVEAEVNEDKVKNDESVDMGKGIIEEFKEEEDPQERLCLSDEEKYRDMSNDGHDEDDDEDTADVKMKEHDELRFREHEEFTEAAEERKRRKEFEIFVGGLDRDTTEEEVKRFFQNVGEVVEVRMHKELPTNKNKGYAFVRFATKEQVARALAEMKNPVIHGKRCGTAPSEDNDTLFLGNICNTWTKED